MILSTLLLASASNHPGVVCLVGMATGIYAFYCGFRMLQRRRIILDTPVSKVRSASMGMVELSGLAVGPYTLTSPIAARPCYYYRTLVWEYKQSGKDKQWVKVAAECMHVPFFLDDNTGKVLVDPRGAELDLHRDFQQEFSDSFFTTKEGVPDTVRLLLSRHGVNTTNRVKVEEYCIKPKNALFLLGTLAENPGIELSPQPIHDAEYNTLTFGKSLWGGSPEGASINVSTAFGSHNPRLQGSSLQEFSLDQAPLDQPSIGQRLAGATIPRQPAYREAALAHAAVAAPQVVRLSASPSSAKGSEMTQQEKIAAALMKAGINHPAAWAAAGLSQPEIGQAESGEFGHDPSGSDPSRRGPTANTQSDAAGTPSVSSQGFETRPRVALMKGSKNPTFLISWRSQREVATSLAWKCALLIWGGPALVLLSLYSLLKASNLI